MQLLNKKLSKQSKHKHQHHHSMHHSHSMTKLNKWFWIKNIIIFLLAIFYVSLTLIEPNNPIKWAWHYGIWMPIASYIVFWEGRNYFKLYPKLIKRNLDMDTLIGIAGHTLYIYSLVLMFLNLNSPMFSYDQMWEAPIILFTITNIGHALEEKLTYATTKTYEQLKNIKNSQVILLRDHKKIETTAINIKINDLILVKTGELIPLDGTIQIAKASLDYSNITGESKTVHLKHGDKVASGSFNVGETLIIKVTKKYQNSTINQIINKIEDASATKPRVQKIADNVLRWFIPSIFGISILTFTIWIIFEYTLPNGITLPWLSHIGNSNYKISDPIQAAMTVLAIACPCALGIATPLVVTVTTMLSIQSGLLINNGNSLENINHIKYFAFDKTGTITTDQLIVNRIIGKHKWLSILKALESNIKHPIANAINDMKIKTNQKVKNIKILKNQGIKGIYKNQQIEAKRYHDHKNEFNNNFTLIGLFVNKKPKLILELKNKIKPGVKTTINYIKKQGYIPIMITGDNQQVAKFIAKQVGIQKVYADVKPNEKSKIIKNLKGGVIFVGDGFNDAIAIKTSAISIAFSSGSDITNSLADISITNQQFKTIINFIKIAKMNKRVIRISMTWALLFNLITIPIAMILLVPPWAGATIMSTSDILVVFTALIYKKIGSKIKNNLSLYN